MDCAMRLPEHARAIRDITERIARHTATLQPHVRRTDRAILQRAPVFAVQITLQTRALSFVRHRQRARVMERVILPAAAVRVMQITTGALVLNIV